MGAAFAAQAASKGAQVLWCPFGRSQASHDRARQAGLVAVDDLGALLEQAGIVMSICPSTAAQHVATQVAERGFQGLYIEANVTSPQRSQRIAERLINGGARVVDGAIFGPPPHVNTPAALYLSGEPADTERAAALFDGTAVEVIQLDGPIGAASALKMAYSSYQKTSTVLAAVAHALAARYGVTRHLLTEASHTTHVALSEPERFPAVAANAWRWAPELHELADTLAADQLPTDFALSAAALLSRWDGLHDTEPSLETVFERLQDET
jgi:3-hydroxyisobutyrate dehydrogenase-like beta-hydroxyacid dehydrogenase